MDEAFLPRLTESGGVDRFLLQSDGKVVVFRGVFTEFSYANGQRRTGLARFEMDGALDASFSPQVDRDGFIVRGVEDPTDGSLFVIGTFRAINGVARVGLAKLTASGSVATDFVPEVEFAEQRGWNPYDVAVQRDGRVIVAGGWGVIRLHRNGSLDTSFRNVLGNFWVQTILLQPDGGLLAAGIDTVTNGAFLTRLQTDGGYDPAFRTPPLTVPISGSHPLVEAIALQTDGGILIGGRFAEVDGIAHRCLARLRPNGSLDASFMAQADGPVLGIAVSGTGEVSVCGQFQRLNEQPRYLIGKLHADGTLNSQFLPARPFTCGGLEHVAETSQGLIACGYLQPSAGRTPTGIVRYVDDGRIDTRFQPVLEAGNSIVAAELLEDGRLLISGDYTWVNDSPAQGLVVLTREGRLDPSFNSHRQTARILRRQPQNS